MLQVKMLIAIGTGRALQGEDRSHSETKSTPGFELLLAISPTSNYIGFGEEKLTFLS